MSADAIDATIPPETIALRRAAHERELLTQRRWRTSVSVTSIVLVLIYVWLLVVVRVMEPFYLIVNVLSIATGLCNIIVFRVFQLPTILAELPRLSDRDRRINLAAIEPIRAELLGRVLPSLGLARRTELAAAMSDDELVQALAGLQRPNWRKRARVWLIAWLIVVPSTLVWVALYRPEHRESLLEIISSRPARAYGVGP